VAAGALEAPTDRPTGLTVDELALRALHKNAVRFNGLDLARWMLREGLAEIREGRLVATSAGVELGGLLSAG
jgi:hypothetical protein